jgi:SAM-dependent methyltransferase
MIAPTGRNWGLRSAATPGLPFVAFTICSRNFLAQAQMLHEMLRRNYPGLAFYVVLCDQPSGIDIDSYPFEILQVDRLGIPSIADMSCRYNITELNTAIKPFGFLSLFDRHPGQAVCYFDPDIHVVSRLDELDAALASGADCVLTPHLCEPAEFAEMDDSKMLQFGIYNLGFCALRDTPQVRRITAWWGRRLEALCLIDLSAGLFVDQKWADLFPAFISATTILRHPGYNVAYWNLSQRTVRRTAGEWLVNGEKLRFFHFSGSMIDKPTLFSRHSYQFRNETLRDVAMLFEEYCDLVHRFGREDYRSIPYAYSWNGSTGKNPHTPSALQTLTTQGSSSRERRALDVGALPSHLPLERAGSLSEYQAMRQVLARKIARRRTFEATLIPCDEAASFEVAGRCVICGAERSFGVGFMYSSDYLKDGRRIPNWREQLGCLCCGYANRVRGALHVLFQEIRPQACDRVYITEQVTPLYAWLAERFPNLIGSEYLGGQKAPGEIAHGVRHEDVQGLSFADGYFDLIMSFDVLEHVPSERRAFAELARCLRPGGALVFTAPFTDATYDHTVRAVQHDDRTIEHLMEPEYHGNPVDTERGSLCFRYFGWRVMDDLRAAGFEEAEGLFYWSSHYAYLGTTNSIFIARKGRV